MIEELKTWLHKQRDYYLDQMNNDNLKKFGQMTIDRKNWHIREVLELEFLEGKVAFCENVLEFIEEELEPKHKDDMR